MQRLGSRGGVGDLIQIPNGNAWRREPITPDSSLPPSLQRGNPLLRQTVYTANSWDTNIWTHANIWSYVRNHGGLKSCCKVPSLGAPVWEQPPWEVMPSNAEPFQEMFAMPTDTLAASPGTDIVLGEFTVPNGMDGVINRFVAQTSAAGFTDFSGQIIWRLLINNRYARNLGNVQNTYGSLQAAFMVPGQDSFRLVSQQTITLIAQVPAGSPVSGGGIVAGAFGWFYPRR